MTELERLGRVDPPSPGVLDAAREVLWSAVAAEMLATPPPDAARTDARTAEEAVGQSRREDPAAP